MRSYLLLVATVGVITIAPAIAAPTQMQNKTVRVSFTVTTPTKGSDGSSRTNTQHYQRTIYISSQGRVFNRHDLREGRNTGSAERGPGTANMRVSGNSLVGVASHASGASQLVVNFGSDFRSCTANVLTGAERGKPIQVKGLNGIVYTAAGKPEISGMSCSVSEGNALAN